LIIPITSGKSMENSFIFTKESWTGESKDGVISNGEGSHFFCMNKKGDILEAYELYESEEGYEVVTPMPEMESVNWYHDLGFEDLEILEEISANEFMQIKILLEKT